MARASWPRIADRTLARWGQLACFAAGPAVLALGCRTSARLGDSPGAIFQGVLLSAAVALLLIVLGLLLPLSVAATGRE